MEHEDWILLLPEEVIVNIIRFTDLKTRQEIGLVCTKFYDCLCQLERDKFPLHLSVFQIIEDDDIYESVINTRRQFKELILDLKYCDNLMEDCENLRRLGNVVGKFGHRIGKFEMAGRTMSESVDIAEDQMIRILGLLPVVNDLTLRMICVTKGEKKTGELNLNKLRKLTVDYCYFETPALFNKIPENVLRSLVFTFEPYNETEYQNFFNRQSLIEKLEIHANDKISLEHLSLRHLKISSNEDLSAIIRSQPKLQFIDFAITTVEDKIFNEVCKLKHLEVLKTLVDRISCREFVNLKNLVTLKELHLDSRSQFERGQLYELIMMRLECLEKLTLFIPNKNIRNPEEIVNQMAKNFPRLKSIKLINRSLNIINIILENFPNLESLMLDFSEIFEGPKDILVIGDGLRYDHLKQLVVTNIHTHQVENSKSLLKLISVCPNLERIMLSKIDIFAFKSIIENQKKLSHFSLECDEFDFINEAIPVILEAKKLNYLRLSLLNNKFPSHSTLKSIFQEKFPKITINEFSTGLGELIMKKSKVPEWYLNFKLMDHF